MVKLRIDKNKFFILLGVLGGLLLVFFSLVESRIHPAKSDSIVATVNGRRIDRSVFMTIHGTLNDERDGANRPFLDEDTVLDRMIDEELLIQKAVELDLPYSDKITRGYLIQSMMKIITKEASNLIPPEPELKKFYNKNKIFFTKADRVAVSFQYVAGKDDKSRAAADKIKTSWESMPKGSSPDSDKLPIPIPSGYMKVNKLADYIGIKHAEALASLEEGNISDPFLCFDGWLIGQVTGKRNTPPPIFEDIESQVLAAYRRDKADNAVSAYLAELKRSSEVIKYENP